MTQFLLVRHAHNDWMKDRLAGWTPGVLLNEEGRAAADALARRLAGRRIDAVYASPLERARETAEFLAHPRGLTVRDAPGVGEVRCGEWTGRRLEDLAKEPLWMAVQHHASGTRLPSGENLAEVQCRAVQALDAIGADHPDGVVAVVSHGDVIKALVAHFVGMHLDLAQRLVVAPASLSIVETTPMGPRLVLFNDTGIAPPPPHPPGPPATAVREPGPD